MASRNRTRIGTWPAPKVQAKTRILFGPAVPFSGLEPAVLPRSAGPVINVPAGAVTLGPSHGLVGGVGYLICGSDSGGVRLDTIEKLDYATEASSAVTAVIPTARYSVSSLFSATKGYVAGGLANTAPFARLTADSLTFATETTAAVTAGLTYQHVTGGGASSATKGFAVMGQYSPASGIESITFSNEAVTNEAVSLPTSTTNSACVQTPSVGYFLIESGNVLETLNLSTITTGTSAATLAVSRQYGAGAYNASHGFIAGGFDGGLSQYTADVDGIQFASDSAVNPTATLSMPLYAMGGLPGSAAGYFAGGTNDVTWPQTFNRFDYNTWAMSTLSATMVGTRDHPGFSHIPGTGYGPVVSIAPATGDMYAQPPVGGMQLAGQTPTSTATTGYQVAQPAAGALAISPLPPDLVTPLGGVISFPGVGAVHTGRQAVEFTATGRADIAVPLGGSYGPYLDHDWDKVALLLHMEGVNGASVFTDEVGHVISVDSGSTGQPTTSTTQVKYGSTSGYWTNANPALITPNKSDLMMYGDFTVEFWLWMRIISTGHSVIAQRSQTWPFSPLETARIREFFGSLEVVGDNGSTIISVAHGKSAGTFVHFAVTKEGHTWRAFADGALLATADSYDTFGLGFTPLTIGGATDGYIDDLRVTNGVARYVAAFTPPARAHWDPSVRTPLTFAGSAPSVAILNRVVAWPGAGALGVSGQLPAPIDTRRSLPEPATAAVVGQPLGYARTADSWNYPAGTALGIGGLTPTCVTTQSQYPVPAPGTMVTAGLPVSMTRLDNHRVLPGVASVGGSGLAPSAQLTPVAAVAVRDVVLAGAAPVCGAEDSHWAQPSTGSAAFAAAGVAIAASDRHTIVVPEAQLRTFTELLRGDTELTLAAEDISRLTAEVSATSLWVEVAPQRLTADLFMNSR